MDDSAAVAAAAVVVSRKVRPDRNEGLAGGAGLHQRLKARVVGGGVMGDGSTRRKGQRRIRGGAEKIRQTSPANIPDMIDDARRGFVLAGRGCLVRFGEDEPRYATASEIAARLEPHPDATMLLTAVSEAVERYDPAAPTASGSAAALCLGGAYISGGIRSVRADLHGPQAA